MLLAAPEETSPAVALENLDPDSRRHASAGVIHRPKGAQVTAIPIAPRHRVLRAETGFFRGCDCRFLRVNDARLSVLFAFKMTVDQRTSPSKPARSCWRSR